MQDISILLDTEPTPELCVEMVECDILQKQAHEELCAYDKHKKFLYKHPLVVHQQKMTLYLAKIEEIRKNRPQILLCEVTNLIQNIRRIKSNIRNKKSKDINTLKKWELNLEIAKTKYDIITSMFSS